MTNPKRQKVTKSAKKAELLDRTTSERNFCSVCQYYYSEMFTCPICYGAELERERITKVMKDLAATRDILQTLSYPFLAEEIEAAIKKGQGD